MFPATVFLAGWFAAGASIAWAQEAPGTNARELFYKTGATVPAAKAKPAEMAKTAPAKKRLSTHMANPTGSPESRLVAGIELVHQV